MSLLDRIRRLFQSEDSRRRALYEKRLREALREDFRWQDGGS